MDDYIYSQSVHKDFHQVMSFLIKFIRDNHGDQHMETFFTRAAAYIYKPLIERIKKNNLISKRFITGFELHLRLRGLGV